MNSIIQFKKHKYAEKNKLTSDNEKMSLVGTILLELFFVNKYIKYGLRHYSRSCGLLDPGAKEKERKDKKLMEGRCV